MMRRRTLAWLVSLAYLGCAEPRVTGPRPKAIGQTTMERVNSPQLRVDLLFVIDNSASMAAKQAMVLQRLATVIQQLHTF